MSQKTTISAEQFFEADIRIGTVLSAYPNAGAKKPAYVLTLDFGSDIGTRVTSAQLTELYEPEALIGRQVAAVVNFPAKRVAGVRSEVLVLAAVEGGGKGRTVLLRPDLPVYNGAHVA